MSALIIAFSRPAGVLTLLESLSANRVERIYVSIDGPRDESDKVNQAEILRILRDFEMTSGSEIYVRANEANLGVAAGVISAIDWFFAQEPEGLILEDDLVVGDDFYRFALTGLTMFRNDSSVWMISGTQLFPNGFSVSKETWTNYPMIWGWAGWAEKWNVMRSEMLKDKKVSMSNLLNRRWLFWSVGANRALEGKVDTWDIPLAFEFWRLKKFCIIPPVNLISNIGDDEFSTHTTSDNSALRQNIQVLPADFQYMGFGDFEQIKLYNSKLEESIFKVKNRHILLPYYSKLLDWFRFPSKHRKSPLRLRINRDDFKAP
jgi:hypothetical protein